MLSRGKLGAYQVKVQVVQLQILEGSQQGWPHIICTMVCVPAAVVKKHAGNCLGSSAQWISYRNNPTSTIYTVRKLAGHSSQCQDVEANVLAQAVIRENSG